MSLFEDWEPEPEEFLTYGEWREVWLKRQQSKDLVLQVAFNELKEVELDIFKKENKCLKQN